MRERERDLTPAAMICVGAIANPRFVRIVSNRVRKFLVLLLSRRLLVVSDHPHGASNQFVCFLSVPGNGE